MPVPVSRTAPTGKSRAAISQAERSSNPRVRLAVLVEPSKAIASPRSTRIAIGKGSSGAAQTGTIPGPSEQDRS